MFFNKTKRGSKMKKTTFKDIHWNGIFYVPYTHSDGCEYHLKHKKLEHDNVAIELEGDGGKPSGTYFFKDDDVVISRREYSKEMSISLDDVPI